MLYCYKERRAEDCGTVTATATGPSAILSTALTETTPDTKGPKPNYPIGSVDKALRLLLSFSDRQSIRVADASRDIGVARSTAHRLLEMLQHHGFVQQDPASRAYVPGPALLELGLSVIRGLDLRRVARPVIEELCDEVKETVHLVTLSGRDMLILDSVESPRMVRIGSRLGDTLEAHAAAGGQALLATLPIERFRELYPEATLPEVTAKTRTSRQELEAELAQVAERGYAISIGEVEPEVGAVGAIVPTTGRVTPCAITISVPRTRLKRGDIPRLGDAAVRAAQQIASALDH